MTVRKRLFSIVAALCAVVTFTCCGSGAADAPATQVNDVSDLQGKKVALLSGSLQDLVISDEYPQITALRFSSSAELIAAVVSGQADYFLNDSTAVIGSNLEKMGLETAFMSDVVTGHYGFAFNKDSAALHDEFNSFLSSLRSEGLLDEIMSRWIDGDASSAEMPVVAHNPSGETLRIGTSAFFPFSFIRNGEYAGLEAEIMERFAAATGRNIEFMMMDFSGMIAALSVGKVDIAACSMTITEERAKQVLFSDPYFYCRTLCCGRAADVTKAGQSFIGKIRDGIYDNLILEDRWKLVTDGLWETLIITILSILLGSVFGAFICWMRLSRRKALSRIAYIYVEIIRGIPILVLLMLMFYVVFAEGGLAARWVAVISFALNFGAYVSEMFRTGIESVDKGQTEAGLAMGFSPVRTFFQFVVPQALTKVIPVFKGEAVSLLKNTSVVGFIAIQDLTKASEFIRARTFDAFFPLIVISVIYFLLAWIISRSLDLLAKGCSRS